MSAKLRKRIERIERIVAAVRDDSHQDDIESILNLAKARAVSRNLAQGVKRLDARVRPAIKVRFGNLRRLPEDYRGERHRKIVKHLPDRNGQEWVEFEEVPGPAPSAPPEPGVAKYLNIVLVAPYGTPE